jgi:hypothetical protein
MVATTKRKRRRRASAIDLAALEHKTAFTVAEFCARNSICRASLDNYIRQGIGPKITQPVAGGRRTITREAETEWHRRLEANPPRGRGRPAIAAGEVASAP